MAVSNGQTTALEMKMRLREKPLSELIEEMEHLSSTSDYDVDLLCAYLDVLEEKAPVLPEGYDPAAQYEKFKENHAELFDPREPEKPKSSPSWKGSFLRARKVLVALAATLGLLVLVADANGAGVINRLVEWGGEIFSLRPASGSMELKSAGENGFFSLQDALDSYEVEGAAIPTWIPSRYSIDRITALELNDTITVSSRYISGDDTLLIRVAIGFKETTIFEKDLADGHVLYKANGITYILSTNMEEERAVWTANGYIYSAGGDVTESELKEMLGSIQTKE